MVKGSLGPIDNFLKSSWAELVHVGSEGKYRSRGECKPELNSRSLLCATLPLWQISNSEKYNLKLSWKESKIHSLRINRPLSKYDFHISSGHEDLLQPSGF